MKKRMRFISLVLSFLMVISSFSFTFGTTIPEEANNLQRFNGTKAEKLSLEDKAEKISVNDNELDMNAKVSVIIELEDKAVLDYPQVQTLGVESFLQTETADRIRNEIISTQEFVQAEINKKLNADIEFKYAYTNVMSGFAAVVQRKDIAIIKAMPGVKNVYRDTEYNLPEPLMGTGAGMVNAPKTWETGFAGEGMVVAVLDTGVDVNHELMLLSDNSTGRIKESDISSVLARLNATKRANGISAAELYKNAKFPYTFDYADKDKDAFADNSDHGVHVSGIVAANGDAALAKNIELHTANPFNGVAPEAQIIGMKIFSSTSSSAYTSDTLAAIDDAITLGVDAINMSIGSVAGFTDDSDGEAFSYETCLKNAREAGILIVVSAGNANKVGYGSLINTLTGLEEPLVTNVDSGLLGSPSAKYYSTSVASIENTNVINPYILGPNDLKIGFSDTSDTYIPSGRSFEEILSVGTYEYVVCSFGAETDFEGKDLSGKIALVQRGGGLSFYVKVNNAAAAGARGVIVYNNTSGIINLNLTGITEDVPAISITMADGEALAAATEKKITVNKMFRASMANEFGYQMSDFTSWGATPDLKLKPEITAPGGQIYSTLTNNEYGLMSGTSMASPHVAGGMAIMQQYANSNSKFEGMTLKDRATVLEALLMSTAKTIIDPTTDNIYSPRRQGAGLMDLEAATKSNVYLMNSDSGKAKIELFDKIGNTFDVEFDIINLSNENYDYELSGSVFSEYFRDLGVVYTIYSEALQFEDAEMLVTEDANISFSEATTASAIRINPIGAPTTSEGAIKAVVTAKPGTTHVKVTVNLSVDDTDFLSSIFTNGFFVEGFVELISLGEQPDLSIPYMGFYGDWTAAPAIDGSERYDASYSTNKDGVTVRSVDYRKVYWPGSFAYFPVGTSHYYLGRHINGYFNRNWIAFSPNEDGVYDSMGYRVNLLRNVKYIKVDVKDSAGNVIANLMDEYDGSYPRKSHVYSNPLNTYYMPAWDGTNNIGNKVQDGRYFYVMTTLLDYPGAMPKETKVPVIVDTMAPERISNITIDDVNKVITFDATDNAMLSYAELYQLNGEVVAIDAYTSPIPGGYAAEFVLDYSAITGKYATLVLVDTAGNVYEEIILINAGAKEPHKVTFKLNGGDINGLADDVVAMIEDGTTVTPSEIVGNVTRNGYDLAGWVKYGETNLFDFTSNPITENTIFVAKWIEKSDHVVTFKLDGGNVAGNPSDRLVVVKDGAKLSKPTEPTKYNYKFIGWFEVGKDTEFDFETAITSSLTLIAKWNFDPVVEPDPNPSTPTTPTTPPTPPTTPSTPEPVIPVEFNDTTNHWAKDDIGFIAGLGLVNGTSEDNFSPDSNMNRGMIVTILGRLAKIDTNNFANSSSFNDVAGGQYYAPFVEWAAQLGLVNGTGNGGFSPEAPLTRQQLAHMLIKYAELMNLNLKSDTENKVQFADEDKVSSYASESVQKARELGIIVGSNGNFDPERSITRAEVITMLARFIRLIEQQ